MASKLTLHGSTSGSLDVVAPAEATGTMTLPPASAVLSGSTAALVSGRMPRASTGGLLIDDANSPTCDASGNVAFKARVTAVAQPAFLAYLSSSVSNVTGAGSAATISFDTEVFDQASNFASNTFTAPVAGKYWLSAQVRFSGLTTAMTSLILRIITSNRTYQTSRINSSTNQTADTLDISVLAEMGAGDTAYVVLTISNGAGDVVDIIGNATFLGTYFGGHLAC